MPVLRTCKTCGRQNRVPVERLADTGRCGACKSSLTPVVEPLEADSDLFHSSAAYNCSIECMLGGPMSTVLRRLVWEDEGQDIAEYAVMLAVILVLVVGTIRLIGSNANNVFSEAASSIQ
jgi:Flp pilus assembly pilin Flp